MFYREGLSTYWWASTPWFSRKWIWQTEILGVLVWEILISFSPIFPHLPLNPAPLTAFLPLLSLDLEMEDSLQPSSLSSWNISIPGAKDPEQYSDAWGNWNAWQALWTHTTFPRIHSAWDANVPAFQTPGKESELFSTLDDDRRGVFQTMFQQYKLSKFVL